MSDYSTDTDEQTQIKLDAIFDGLINGKETLYWSASKLGALAAAERVSEEEALELCSDAVGKLSKSQEDTFWLGFSRGYNWD